MREKLMHQNYFVNQDKYYCPFLSYRYLALFINIEIPFACKHKPPG